MTGSYTPEWQCFVQNNDLDYAQEADARTDRNKSYAYSPRAPYPRPRPSWEDLGHLPRTPSYGSFNTHAQMDYISPLPTTTIHPAEYNWETAKLRETSSTYLESEYQTPPSASRYSSIHASSNDPYSHRMPHYEHHSIPTNGTSSMLPPFIDPGLQAPHMQRYASSGSSSYSNSPPEQGFHNYTTYAPPSGRHHHHQSHSHKSPTSTSRMRHEHGHGDHHHHHHRDHSSSSLESYSAFSERPRYDDCDISSSDSSRGNSASGHKRVRPRRSFEEDKPFTRYG